MKMTLKLKISILRLYTVGTLYLSTDTISRLPQSHETIPLTGFLVKKKEAIFGSTAIITRPYQINYETFYLNDFKFKKKITCQLFYEAFSESTHRGVNPRVRRSPGYSESQKN
jgi:hypothetical protein